MRPSRRVPLLRGAIAASFATFVALASHAWADGAIPGMLGIAVPWILSLMICTLLAGRRLSMIRLSASVLLSQALFHALFVLGSITPGGGFTPHVHGVGSLNFQGAPVLVPEDASMWIAHGFAAIVTIIALHRGERIVRMLAAVASDVAAWLRRTVLVSILLHPAIPRRVRWRVTSAPRPIDPLRAAFRRRGPPLRLS
ncbi:putative integral membrane protein [Microbacterium esteraromaticum]|uniref:Putative integral membrane protein n=1 Tax=Microbacterium esteraromaticum TaxID=57043 RepID=A0A1R4IBE8_9MICO|nr:hypothetical protein [Microbacterium esteraromaticum]SJN17110.1 putative integral membrane protein [Microbacterium esteraromaticum]